MCVQGCFVKQIDGLLIDIVKLSHFPKYKIWWKKSFFFWEREIGCHTCRKHAFLNRILPNWLHIGLNPSFHIIKGWLVITCTHRSLHEASSHVHPMYIPCTHRHISHIFSVLRHSHKKWFLFSQLLSSFWGHSLVFIQYSRSTSASWETWRCCCLATTDPTWPWGGRKSKSELDWCLVLVWKRNMFCLLRQKNLVS